MLRTRRHDDTGLLLFLPLALVLTWVVWVPAALSEHDVIDAGWAETIAPFWSWAPAVAAVIAAAATGALGDLRRRLTRWRVGARWWAVALLGPAAFWCLVAVALLLTEDGWTDVRPGALDAGPSAVFLFAALLCTDGFGEETGWRGFALPRLLHHAGPLPVSLALGLFWAVWHLPLVFTPGSALDGSPVWYNLLGMPALSVAFTWLFLRTGGSALLAIVLHASSNFWTPVALPDGPTATMLVALAALWLVAAALVPSLRSARPSAVTLRG